MNVAGLFHAWGNEVTAGIGWELVMRAVGEVRPGFFEWDLPRDGVVVFRQPGTNVPG